MNSRLARLLGALLAITLIAAACGGDDDDTTAAVGQPAGEDGEAEAPSEDDVDPDAANHRRATSAVCSTSVRIGRHQTRRRGQPSSPRSKRW